MTRTRRKARQGRLHAQATTFTLRHEAAQPALGAHDMHVIYPLPMGGTTREIDRQEWSRVVVELLETEAGGNRTRLAEMIGVKYLTIKRWIDATHSVSEDNVRAVARVFKLSPLGLLIRVGYYRHEELAPEAAEAPTAGDEILEMIASARITPSQKREIREHVRAKRAEAEAALKSDVERWINLVRPRR